MSDVSWNTVGLSVSLEEAEGLGDAETAEQNI